MSNIFDDVWRLLADYSFVIDLDVLIDMKCSICDKLFIKPCNIPCGCRFCYDCIMKYLSNKEKYCPNKLKYCKIKSIIPDKDVAIDHPMNLRISKILVKCTNESCDVEDELCSIENHMKICRKNITICPYFHIGCQEGKLRFDQINNHLNEHNFIHTKLLFKWINNSFGNQTVPNYERNNENGSINSDEFCEKKLYEKIENLEIDIKIIQEQLKSLKQDKTDGLSISQFSNELMLKNLDKNIKSIMKENIFGKEWFEEEMAKSILSINAKSDSQLNDINNLKILWQKAEIDQKKIVEKIDEFRQSISHLTINLNQIEQIVNRKIDNLQKKMLEIELNSERKENTGDYLWKIDNFSKKLKEIQRINNTKIYSDPFNSNYKGRKMCLCLWEFDEYLCCGFCLLRGQFDSLLEWPAKLDVIIDLIDQNNNLPFESRALTYNSNPNNEAWKRPKNEKNIGFGDKLIQIDELLNNSSLISGDKIFIKCTVKTL